MSKAVEEGRSGDPATSISGSIVAEALEDESTIKGQLDPVYEAKARVLNKAVSIPNDHGICFPFIVRYN